MKKTITLIMLVCTTIFVAQAQTRTIIKGGFGITNVCKDSEMEGKMSYKVGLTSDISLSKTVAIRPTLYFSHKRYESKISEATLTTNANYLELPICLVARLPLTKNIGIGINMGPYAAYGIGGKTKLAANGYNDSWKTFEGKAFLGTTQEVTKRFDWGATAGVSINLFFLHIGFNYDLGLKNIHSMSKIDRNEHIKNGMWWVSVGIIF